ncbi:unnamed protein product [Rotaria sp. Silwood1]|nr:unnamed protein product [Rotaria sp. Silwood1]
MIIRGREIAYQAANSPTIPSSMPNYTDDQIRELYGELDKKTRRLQENEYIFHTPMIDAWNEKSPWTITSSIKNQLTEQCPLPKFHIDKNEHTILMNTYLSTGLSNPRIIQNTSIDTINDKEIIHGSFRTSIGDRTTISPSPLLLNVNFDYKTLKTISTNLDNQSTFLENIQQKTSINSIEKPCETIDSALSSFDLHKNIDHHSSPKHLNEKLIKSKNNIKSTVKTSETMDMDSLIDLDDETTISYNTADEFHMEIDPDSLVTHNDLLNIIKISENNNYYNSSISTNQINQQNILTNNFSELIDTFNHTDNQLLSIKHQENLLQYEPTLTYNIDHLIIKDDDIDKHSSMENLINIVYDMNKKQSNIDHSSIISNDITIQTEKELKINEQDSNDYSFKVLTDNQNESIKVSNSNPIVYQTLSTPSEKLTYESFNEINNLDSITHEVESLIEPEQNVNVLKSDLSSINNLSQIFNNSFLKNQNDHHHHHKSLFNEENDKYCQKISDIDEDFEELYQRYVTNIDQYQTMLQPIDKFEQNQHILTPISEESTTLGERTIEDKIIKANNNEQYCLILTIQRQSNHIGHYGFELAQTIDGNIIISSIIDSNYCPNLCVGDEIISINNISTLITLEQCYLLFHSLWYNQCEYVQIIVNKPTYISIIPSK